MQNINQEIHKTGVQFARAFKNRSAGIAQVSAKLDQLKAQALAEGMEQREFELILGDAFNFA